MAHSVSGTQELRALIHSIPLNEKLRLRDDVLPRARKREWVFKGLGDGDGETILLAPELEEYVWEAKIDYIDWEKYLNKTN
jgi:hypothetical protein